MTTEPDILTLRYLRKIDARMDEVFTTFGAAKQRLTLLEKSVTIVGQRIDILSERVDIISDQVDRVDTRLDRIERRLGLVEADAI
jgi:hypothetical protein